MRAYLDYYGISYDVVEVDPVLRQSIKWSNYKKVPIMIANFGDAYQVRILFKFYVGESSVCIPLI